MKTFLCTREICKKVYQHLIAKKASLPLKSQNKWLAEAIISENLNINWKRTYSLAFLCTKETKLREFQLKLLHRRIATNDFLHKIGLKPNDVLLIAMYLLSLGITYTLADSEIPYPRYKYMQKNPELDGN